MAGCWREYDVVVVGGGPTGCVAAKTAARLGVSVLLVDKKLEPGTPVECAEAVGREVFEKLGIPVQERWIAARIKGIRLVAPNGVGIRLEERSTLKSKVGYVLERKIFEKDLLAFAIREGAETLLGAYVYDVVMDGKSVKGVRVRFRGETREIGAKVVIGADGISSGVGRLAGLDTTLRPDQVEAGAQYEMVGVDLEDSETLEFYFGSKIAPGGYAWIFPKGEDTANVGLGVVPTLASGNAWHYLDKFVSTQAKLKKAQVLEINFGGIPGSEPVKKSVAPGLLLAGDAARHADPLTGGGIANGMLAGSMAAETAVKAVQAGDTSEESLMEYERSWRREFGKKLEKTFRIRKVLQELSDEDLNRLAEALKARGDVEELSSMGIVRTLFKLKPQILFKLKDLI
ncbi:MAG: NAD(P)/FAD-dependent oxidoreductase [Methanobacteriota archaeon]|nr:MAG: NAD(P)/FAD-dependent oxidoreductase [Euryarchaeota archaeon]